ncbi:HNH endonuclease signature motif containing protein [Phycicoccus sp.]|uniref:HNH endonuclease signature motif containing protein n=1 Tax=Phycicoccus sp. TaxID=1902410 RepID=UPI002C84C4FD|nr:HNH endonuclease signature motif containing protein [Phycicoccus sp.]HMM96475.1 HNH endonuclease signature motif containing protein [Phycicoccus sp.]
MTTSAGPQDVVDLARRAAELLGPALESSPTTGSREDWAAALTGLGALAARVEAARDVALVRLAAIEPEVLDDGELVETHRTPGHVALDAPAIASGALCVGAVQAERLVREAVRRAADGPEGSDTSTGLGGLHAAMAAGRLDAYRASVVASELEEASPALAAAIVAGLDEHLEREDATRLRRRVRRMLARVGPEVLRRAADRAREGCSLRRWAAEPGVDTWLGTFPAEDAARAWAAVDALAQQHVADGTCATVERARAQALIDLVTGNATIDLRVVLTTPVESAAGPTPPTTPAAPGDLVEVGVSRTTQPVLVPREWLARTVSAAPTSCSPCHPDSGALVDPDGELATEAYRAGSRLTDLVRTRDGRCRFPGCHVAARFCDLDHVVPWPVGPTAAANLACLCRRHHRVKQRPGWSAVLAPDGSMTWTDPTGRTRTTHPLDALDPVVLPDAGTDEDGRVQSPSRHDDEAPHSALEFRLEHALAGQGLPPPGCRFDHPYPQRTVTVSSCHTRAHGKPPPPTAPPF